MNPEPRNLGTALRKARALIASPDRFISSGYAADATGRWRPVGGEDAVRFSLIGAVIRCGANTKDLMTAASRFLQPHSPLLYERVTAAELDLSHAEAIEVLDVLVAAVEKEAPYVPKQSGFVSSPSSAESSTLEDLARRLARVRAKS